jgi:drug/metabolite transporter (DMT)-like permease
MNSTNTSSHSIRTSLLRIHLPLLLIQGLFAILPTMSKIAFRVFSPEAVVFFRIVGSAALFSMFYFPLFREPIVEKKHYLYFAVFAFFGVAGNQFLFIKGVSYTTAINASILISTIPIFTLILAILLRKEPFTLSRFLGVILALIGVGILLGAHQLTFQGYMKGNIFILLNSASFSFYLVISKPILTRYKPITVITYMFLFASLEIAPLTLKEVLSIPYSSLQLGDWVPPIILVVFGTFIPYMINKQILQRTYSSIVAIYTYIQPLLGSLLAILILDERFTLRLLLSALLILVGVTIVSFHKVFPILDYLMRFGSRRDGFNKNGSMLAGKEKE